MKRLQIIPVVVLVAANSVGCCCMRSTFYRGDQCCDPCNQGVTAPALPAVPAQTFQAPAAVTPVLPGPAVQSVPTQVEPAL